MPATWVQKSTCISPTTNVHAASNLEADLRAAPVPALRVVPDPVARAHADPLRDGAVLLELGAQRLLCPQRLVGGLRGAREGGG